MNTSIRQQPWLYFLIPVILILSLYTHTLGFKLGNLDEDIIVRSADVLRDSAITDILRRDAFLSKDGLAFYRPLQNLSLMIDARISQNSAPMFRLSNILIHCIVSILIIYLLMINGVSLPTAAGFSSLFAVHPLFVHTVAWIPARGDLLMTLFSLITIISVKKYQDKKKRWWLLLSVTGYLAALFSKETAIVMLLLLFVLNGADKRSIMQTIGFFMMLIIVTVSYIIIRKILITGPFHDEFGLLPALSNWQTIPESIAKITIPFFHAPMPKYTTVVTITGLTIVTLLFYYLHKQKQLLHTAILTGLLWFVLFLLPGMAFRHSLADTGYDYLEHRFYMPAIGILAGLALFIKNKHFGPVFFIIPIILFSILTIRRTSEYKTPVAFYSAAIHYNPRCAIAWYGRGNLYKEAQQYDKAIADFTEALQLKPDYFEALNNRGIARFNTKRYDEAIADYNQALQINPHHAQTYNNRANAYSASGRLREAIADYNKTLALDPTLDATFYNRGACWARQGMYDSAMADFNELIRRDSLYTLGYVYRAFTYMSINDKQNALTDFNTAIRQSPSDPQLFIYRGDIFYSLGRFTDAVNDYSRSLMLQPQQPALLIKRGLLYYTNGNTAQACEDWHTAKRLGSDEAANFVAEYCQN